MSVVNGVYTAAMNLVKYFALVALAAAALSVAACCPTEKAPPPAPAPTGYSK